MTSSIGRAGRAVASLERTRNLLNTVGSAASRSLQALRPVAGAIGSASGPIGIISAGYTLAAISDPRDPEEGKRARFGTPLSHSDFQHEIRHGARIPTQEPSSSTPSGESQLILTSRIYP